MTRSSQPRERADAERVYGVSAAFAVFSRRPEDVISIAYTKEARRRISEMLREAARRRIAYREMSDEALSRIARSLHHEGVCLLVRLQPEVTLEAVARSSAKPALVLALDQVDNPHNVGAILRSAAYFGAAALLLGGKERSALSAAARRVAEGGAELVPIARAPRLAPALRELAEQGWSVIGADVGARLTLDKLGWPERVVLALGNEREGLTPETRKACGTLVRIAGSGAVESLNVSVTAGIFLAGFHAARLK